MGCGRPEIDPAWVRSRAAALTLALVVACAGAPPTTSGPSDSPAAINDAGADATPGPALADASVVADRGDATAPPPPSSAPSLGPIFVGADGTCWQQEQITCATNTDCKLPPHRRVECPRADD